MVLEPNAKKGSEEERDEVEATGEEGRGRLVVLFSAPALEPLR